MKTFKTTLLLVILAAFISCNLFKRKGENLFNPTAINLPAGGQQIVSGNNQLGFDLLKQLSDKKGEPGNNMVSPFSLSTVLSMLYQGSGSQTQTELANVLHINGLGKEQIAQTYNTLLTQLPDVDKKVTLYPANSLWLKSGFVVNQDYLNLISQKYLAQIFIREFDNSTVDEINHWVSQKTKGKITKMVDDLNGYVTVLLNAIYFYGKWLDQFPKSNTEQMPFHINPTQTVNVPMMNDEISYMRMGYNDSLVIGELYYGQGNYSMVVIIPQAEHTLKALIDGMNTEKFDSLLQLMGVSENVPVYLPKFKFTFSYKELKDQLTQLGLQSLFSDSADLDDINPKLYIDKIIQKTYIEVNEEGTEAAAATAAFGMTTSMPPVELKANRPFMFAIRETTTGLVLFLGTVTNPALNE